VEWLKAMIRGGITLLPAGVWQVASQNTRAWCTGLQRGGAAWRAAPSSDQSHLRSVAWRTCITRQVRRL